MQGRPHQSYGYAPQPQHQRAPGRRVINPPPMLTQNVNFSQIDPSLMGSQQQHIMQQHYAGMQGHPQSQPQFQQRPQPQQPPQQQFRPVQQLRPPPQQRPPQQYLQYAPQPAQHQYEGLPYGPQQGHPQVRRRIDTGDRRVAPRLEAPQMHLQWAADQRLDPNVLAQMYRGPPSGQMSMQHHDGQQDLARYAIESPPDREFYAAHPQFNENLANPADQYQSQQPGQYLVGPQQFVPQQQFEDPSLQEQPYGDAHQQWEYSPPPVMRYRPEDGEHYQGLGYGPGGTQLEELPDADCAPSYYGGQGMPTIAPPINLQQFQSMLDGMGMQQQQAQQNQRPPTQQVFPQQHQRSSRQDDTEDFEDTGHVRVRKDRVAPPIDQNVSSRLAAHTTPGEYEAFNMSKNYIARGIVCNVWGDGSVWGIHTVTIENMVAHPLSHCGGRATVIKIMQRLEVECETAFRQLQNSAKYTRPSERHFQLPYSIFDQCSAILHYIAAVCQTRDQLEGANKLGYVYALYCAKPTEWEAMKLGWLAAARQRSPFGKLDPFLNFDGSESSMEAGGQNVVSQRPLQLQQQQSEGGAPRGPPRGPGGKKPQGKQASPDRDHFTAEKLARTAAQRAAIPKGAKDKSLCLNCGSADHFGDSCTAECLRCEENHPGSACPKNRPK